MRDSKPEPSHRHLPPGTGEPPPLEPAVDPGARARRIHRRQAVGFLASLSLSMPLAASLWWPGRRAMVSGGRPNPPPDGPAPPPARPQPAEPPAAAARAPALALVLTARQAAIRLGEPAGFEAFLVNVGSEPTTVILPGDGSNVGWRTPIVRWSPPMGSGSRCGNINAGSMDEIVVLQPGERVALSWLGWPAFEGSGTYPVTLEIEHDPRLEWRGVPLGSHPPQFMERLRSIPPYRVHSNAVEIRVE